MEYGIPKPARVPKGERERNPLKPEHPKTHERYQGLKSVGKRGKRLGKGDKAAQELIEDQTCVCGCSADPLEGEVCRAHLESRAYESTRNEPWNNLPGCQWVNRWLDTDGVTTRALLLEMAQHKWEHHKETLTHAEVWPRLDAGGFYGWMAQQRTRGRF